MIHIDSIKFSYKKRKPVFDDFSLQIKPGITLFKGFSGCGKTTLLRILAGFLDVSAGEVNFPEGFDRKSKTFMKKDMSFVFQSNNLLPLTTFRRNCELAANVGGTDSEFEAKLSLWSKRLGVDHLLDERPYQLSGGQCQRASMTRALVRSPKFLFMDEPSSGLDDINTSILTTALKEYLSSSTEECYIIISTHDSRMELIANEIHDFNHLLLTEGHLQSLAGATI
jgi:ABC-type lipoprotein export system ATPase subunit